MNEPMNMEWTWMNHKFPKFPKSTHHFFCEDSVPAKASARPSRALTLACSKRFPSKNVRMYHNWSTIFGRSEESNAKCRSWLQFFYRRNVSVQKGRLWDVCFPHSRIPGRQGSRTALKLKVGRWPLQFGRCQAIPSSVYTVYTGEIPLRCFGSENMDLLSNELFSQVSG